MLADDRRQTTDDYMAAALAGRVKFHREPPTQSGRSSSISRVGTEPPAQQATRARSMLADGHERDSVENRPLNWLVVSPDPLLSADCLLAAAA